MGTELRLARFLQFGITGGNGTNRPTRPEQLSLDRAIFPPPKDPKREGEFFSLGGVIREADVKKDAKAVNDGLYLQQSAIEHFSDVTPNTTSKDLQHYYKDHPSSKLFVAEIGTDIVGAVTVAPEEGLHSAKINRIVRKEDRPGLGIGEALGRHAVDFCFASPPEGLGVSSITIGVILGVDGSPAALRLFQRLGFELVKVGANPKFEDRCDGYSKEQGKLVRRNVAMMVLTRGKYQSDREIEKLEQEEKAKGTSTPPISQEGSATIPQ